MRVREFCQTAKTHMRTSPLYALSAHGKVVYDIKLLFVGGKAMVIK